MKAPLYIEVHQLSIDMVNASEQDDHKRFKSAYKQLKKLCLDNEMGDLDHPLQWEALGDFSEDHEQRLLAYQKGLSSARHHNLPEYCASILFAKAESFLEADDIDQADQMAKQAREALGQCEGEYEQELGIAINEFLVKINTTVRTEESVDSSQ